MAGTVVGDPMADGLAGVHFGKHEQPGQARLDDAEAAGGDRDHADDAGYRVGHQDQRGAPLMSAASASDSAIPADSRQAKSKTAADDPPLAEVAAVTAEHRQSQDG
jgi:hypothetical protein